MSDPDLVVLMSPIEEIENSGERVERGQWYWVDDADRRWLGCVVGIGSNYFKLEGVKYERRVSDLEFADMCTFVPQVDAECYIAGRQDKYRLEACRLMSEVQRITAALGTSGADSELTEIGEASVALVVSGEDPLPDYKAALVRAKDEQLPELFEQLKEANERRAEWLKAPLLPAEALIGDHSEVLRGVTDRIFSVELYAGLTEDVVQISEGDPADKSDKLHLMQRMHYMDEECLSVYLPGGLCFKHIDEFDSWVADPRNRDRLLPFSRTALAFRVRRNRRDRGYSGGFGDFLRFAWEDALDRQTFLYIRNGEQLYRLSTEVEFGERLFPDPDHDELGSGEQLVAEMFGDRVDKIIPLRRHEHDVAEYEREMGEWETKARELYPNTVCECGELAIYEDPFYWSWNSQTHEMRLQCECGNEWTTVMVQMADDGRGGVKHLSLPSRPRDYELDRRRVIDRDDVYFDDAMKKLQEDLDAYHRIVLILQGLFDRSPVLHPHSKVKLWTDQGLAEAVELHYDQDRAMSPGDAPDFDAYHQRCNVQITVGSVVYGQLQHWHEKMQDEDRSTYGNPGPSRIGKMAKLKPRAGKAVFQWMRETMVWKGGKPTKASCRHEVELDKLFNFSAYKAGDFHQFFDDPRTRAKYLKWAPTLLLAEEWLAGHVDDRGRVRNVATAENRF